MQGADCVSLYAQASLLTSTASSIRQRKIYGNKKVGGGGLLAIDEGLHCFMVCCVIPSQPQQVAPWLQSLLSTFTAIKKSLQSVRCTKDRREPRVLHLTKTSISLIMNDKHWSRSAGSKEEEEEKKPALNTAGVHNLSFPSQQFSNLQSFLLCSLPKPNWGIPLSVFASSGHDATHSKHSGWTAEMIALCRGDKQSSRNSPDGYQCAFCCFKKRATKHWHQF